MLARLGNKTRRQTIGVLPTFMTSETRENQNRRARLSKSVTILRHVENKIRDLVIPPRVSIDVVLLFK